MEVVGTGRVDDVGGVEMLEELISELVGKVSIITLSVGVVDRICS